jgi:hypothetical protein
MKILDIVRFSHRHPHQMRPAGLLIFRLPKKQAPPSAAQKEDRSDIRDFHHHDEPTLAATAAGVKHGGRHDFLASCRIAKVTSQSKLAGNKRGER